MKLVAGQRFYLKNENQFAKAISGKLEVYAVTRNASSFRQIFLLELAAGDVAFPSIDEFGYIDFLIYAVDDSEIDLVGMDALPPQALRPLMQNWFVQLVELPWLRLMADLGDDVLQKWRTKSLFLSDDLDSDDLKEEFVDNEQILSMLLGMKFRAEDEKLTRRIEHSEENKRQIVDETIAKLLGQESVVYQSSSADDSGVDFNINEITYIVKRVASALKIPGGNIDIPPEIAKKLDQLGIIRRLVQKGNMQMRLVELSENWYEMDCGVMLCYYGEKKKLVALIPKSPRSYVMISRDRPKGMPVTKEIADEIDNDAFVVHAGLPPRKLSNVDVLLFMFNHCWSPDWRTIIFVSFFAGLIPIITPIVTETIFRDIIPILDRKGLAMVTQVSAVAGFTTAAINIVRSIAVTRLVTNIDLAVESALFGRLVALPTAFFRKFQSGEIASRFMGMESVVNAVSGDIVSHVFNFLFSFWSFALMCWYSFTLAILVLFISVVMTLISALFVYKSVSLQRKFTAAHNQTAALLQQIFSGLTKFRTAGAEEHAFRLWGERFADEWRWNYKLRWNNNYLSIVSVAQFSLYTLLVYFVTMNYVNEVDPETGAIVKEGISYASFFAFQAAAASFNATIGGFIGSVSGLVFVKPLVENLKVFFEEVPEVAEDKPDADDLHGAIEVRNLCFSYGEDLPEVVKDVSFRIAAGEHVAIVGRSGGGKSTLIRLLLGFEKPTRGVVLYDGQDLAEVNLASVRAQMGVVLQNGQLMSGSIFTNIVGTSALTEKDAWAAAEAAGLADDIKNMPMGMQTIISEGSTNISGGQRQRILIARALAGRPSIVIFDEATSALDNRTQAIVTRSLDKMHATQIIVAHRLSTIRNVDRVIVIDKGQIIENGGFDELVAQGGIFASMVKRQTID